MPENDDGEPPLQHALGGNIMGRVPDNHLFSAKDAAAATSAASSYFPSYNAHNHDWVDGGLRSNCPAAIAIEEARIMWPKRTASALISLGCGKFPHAENAADGDSIYSVLRSVMYVATDAETQYRSAMKTLNNHQPNSINCSLRLNPTINLPGGKKCHLDAVDKIPDLMKETKKYLESTEGRDAVMHIVNVVFAALFFMDFETDKDSLRPKLDTLRIRSRVALPSSFREKLTSAMLARPPSHPFSVVVDEATGAEHQFLWAQCTWIENVMNLPFKLGALPMLRPLTVTVKLHMPVPETTAPRIWPLPISGMPYSLDAAC
jgi:hypothetical protein